MEMWPCCVSVPTVNALQSCAPESFLELSKAEMFTSIFSVYPRRFGAPGTWGWYGVKRITEPGFVCQMSRSELLLMQELHVSYSLMMEQCKYLLFSNKAAKDLTGKESIP